MGTRCFGRIGSPALLLLALAAGLGLRLWLAARLPLEADEAVVGLMARHIGRGERPVFYYGQTYMGALEAYLIAPVFALLGPSVATLRLVPIALGLVAAWLAYRVGRAYYGERTGLFAGLWFALPPLFLTMWTVKARAGYVETLVFGLACLWLAALPAPRPPSPTGRGGDGATRRQGERGAYHKDTAPSPRRGGGLGGGAALSLVAGLGFWTNALILPYLILAAMLATIRAVRARAPIRLAAGAAAFVVGSLPLWLVNLSSGFPTFQELRQANTGASPGEIVSNLGQILRYSGPVLLGLIEPSSNLPAFHEARHERYALWVAGVAATAVLAAGLVGALLAWVVDRRSGDLVLGFVALGVVMSFAVSRVAPLHVGEPRYALPLYSLAPLYLARLAALAEKRPRLAWGALGLLLAMNLGTTLSFTPELAAPRVGGMPLPRSNQELIQALDARGIDRVYTDYWIAYPLAFESGERILPSVITDDLASGFNRYIPYAQAVHDAPRPAYVFIRGSPPDVAYQARPATALPGYRRDEMGPYMIYWAGDRGRGEE